MVGTTEKSALPQKFSITPPDYAHSLESGYLVRIAKMPLPRK
jgi:hypothetical protein